MKTCTLAPSLCLRPPLLAPPGFGLRQSSGAFERTTVVSTSTRPVCLKAAQGRRTPGRWRAPAHGLDALPVLTSLFASFGVFRGQAIL